VGTTVTRSNVNVSQGVFTASLDFGNLFDGTALWLEVAVRSAGAGSYTTLSPRQALTGTPYALGLRPGTVVSGSNGFGIKAIDNTPQGYGIIGQGRKGGVFGQSYENDGWGVVGSAYDIGVYGEAIFVSGGKGVVGQSYDGYGVFGSAYSSTGLSYGVYGLSSSPDGYGGYFENNSSNGVALYASGAGGGRHKATLRVDNTRTTGGMAAYLTNNSNFHTAHLYNAANGGHVLYLQNAHTGWPGTGGEFITAVNLAEEKVFKVTEDGAVYSDRSYNCGLNSGCFNTGAGADLAERVEASEPLGAGDVVEIDAAAPGSFRLCSTPNSTRVAGVISTSPAITMNNDDLSDLNSTERSDTRPLLALVGQVPVKVSAENGGIQPGDLLACSSTPGHAMLAGANAPAGTVIGKALEPLDEGSGVILMLVTLQ
jgi:hypothetical protein